MMDLWNTINDDDDDDLFRWMTAEIANWEVKFNNEQTMKAQRGSRDI